MKSSPSNNCEADVASGTPASATLSTHRRHLALELLASRERFMQHFRPLLTHHSLTEQQWRVMRALAANGDMEPGELTKRCVILKPSLTGILSRMEDLEWIERVAHLGDQRRSVVRLTAAGRVLHRKVSRDVEATYARILHDVGQEEIEALHNALDRFNAALDRLAL